MAKLNVKADHISQILALIQSGDVSLTERRKAFRDKEGRETKLDNDGFIAAIAATDDDDDDLFVANVLTIEKNGWQAGEGVSETFVVPTDVAGFKAGQELTDADQIAAFWRAAFAEQAEDGANLDHMGDEEIVTLISDVERVEDTDEYLLMVFKALEAGGSDTPAEDVAEDIKSVSAKVQNDQVINNWIKRVIEGAKDVDSGPVPVADRFLKLLSKDELGVLPWPGSETGNNPDITKKQNIVNGVEKKPKVHSKVKDFISIQPIIVELHSRMESLERKVPQGGKLSEFPEISTSIKNLNRNVTNATRAYRQAVCLAKLKALFDEHKLIEMEFDTEDQVGEDGKTFTGFARSTYCVTIGSRVKRKSMGTLTVLSLSRAKYPLITGQTTYDQFIAMLKRQKKPKTTTVKYPPADTIADVSLLTSSLVHSLEKTSVWGPMVSDLAYTSGDQKEQMDEIIENIGRIEQLAESFLTGHKLRGRLSLLRKKSDAPPLKAKDEDDPLPAKVA